MLNKELEQRLALLFDFGQDEFGHPSRELLSALAGLAKPMPGYESPASVIVSERAVAGPHGDIPVRVYETESAEQSRRALVWNHGGAFLGGDLDMPEADYVARELCSRSNAVVFSVDYRLARGGVHFPIPHDDVKAVFDWVVATAAGLRIDAGRVALGGASAGGNLAASVALRQRDEDAARPAAILLAYPVLHYAVPPMDAFPADWHKVPTIFAGGPEGHRRVADNYLGGQDAVPYAFPALGDLRGLPPTWILTCEYDDLKPSGVAYAEELRRAGVVAHLRDEKSVPHGHLNIPGLPANEPSLAFLAAALAAM